MLIYVCSSVLLCLFSLLCKYSQFDLLMFLNSFFSIWEQNFSSFIMNSRTAKSVWREIFLIFTQFFTVVKHGKKFKLRHKVVFLTFKVLIHVIQFRNNIYSSSFQCRSCVEILKVVWVVPSFAAFYRTLGDGAEQPTQTDGQLH